MPPASGFSRYRSQFGHFLTPASSMPPETTNASADLSGASAPQVRLPGTVVAAALNFRGVLARLGDATNHDPYKKPPVAPVLYLKPPNTWIGPGDAIPCPQGIRELRMGGTLGVVIGRTACRVRERDALSHVGGYRIVNDVCIPHESYFRPAIRERCRDGFTPMGPAILDPEILPDPDRAGIRVRVNGEMQCSNTTANLVRGVARLIADISEFMTLQAGDVLLVGEPENAPLACPGDRVVVEIDGLGWIENRVVAKAAS
jgi:5-oxopent-3-ene-1,2,5-tricarboxylate decarboxylase/2-hydroxyhepta-2,4-diene-1,7-dioate isomerase